MAGKLKTKKAAAKRFSFTGRGKAKYKKAGLRHGMVGKSANRKRAKGSSGYMIAGDAKELHRTLPYGA